MPYKVGVHPRRKKHVKAAVFQPRRAKNHSALMLVVLGAPKKLVNTDLLEPRQAKNHGSLRDRLHEEPKNTIYIYIYTNGVQPWQT